MNHPQKIILFALCAAMLGGCSTPSGKKEILLTERDADRPLTLAAGDSFAVELKSNPTTGYRWQSEPARPGDGLLQQDRDDFAAPQGGELCGAPGRQRLTFSARKPGQTTLRLVYIRPWEKPPRPVAAFQVPVTVR